ncbi:MAG TPA: hypothetical protein PKE30_03525 [Niabella sp.]|nr:hypothetical protein [Niabella sp.]
MKNVSAILLLAVLIVSCKENKSTTPADAIIKDAADQALELNTPSGKTAGFSVGDFTYSGKVSTQYFGDKAKDGFSIVCQQDEPYALLQATFASEAQVKGSLKPAEGFYFMKPGEAHIALSGAKLGSQEFVTKKNQPAAYQ